MNLDDLISKYLDGELSESEDNELRNEVSNSSDSKMIFDEYVELSYFLNKKFASVPTPEKLKNEVEDKIMMRIMSRELDPSHNVIKQSNYSRSIVFSTFLVFAIFVGIIQLKENEISNKNFSYQLNQFEIEFSDNQNYENANFVNLKNNEFSKIDNFSKKDNLIDNISLSDIIQKENELINSESIKNNLDLSYKNSDNIIVNENQEIQDLERSNISFGESFTNFRSNELKPELLNYNYENVPFIDYNSLEFAFLGSNDLKNIGFTPNNTFQNVNFMVTLKLDKNFKVGIELAQNQYTFNKLTTVVIPYGELNGHQYDPSKGDKFTSGGISTKVETEANYLNYYTMLFVENKMLELDRFKIYGRAGIGASQEGPILNSRLYSEIDLVYGFKLIVGIDYRLFNSNMQNFINQTSGYKQNVSFVYGLNFGF